MNLIQILPPLDLNSDENSKVRTVEKPLGKKFECPNCVFIDGSNKEFPTKHQLNQHLLKVHAEKQYTCGKCGKGFGCESYRRRHEASCGTTWTCTCGQVYTARETLLTHCRRTQHSLPPNYQRRKKSSPGPKSQQLSSQSPPNPVLLVIQVNSPTAEEQKPAKTSVSTQTSALPRCSSASQTSLIVPSSSSRPSTIPLFHSAVQTQASWGMKLVPESSIHTQTPWQSPLNEADLLVPQTTVTTPLDVEELFSQSLDTMHTQSSDPWLSCPPPPSSGPESNGNDSETQTWLCADTQTQTPWEEALDHYLASIESQCDLPLIDMVTLMDTETQTSPERINSSSQTLSALFPYI